MLSLAAITIIVLAGCNSSSKQQVWGPSPSIDNAFVDQKQKGAEAEAAKRLFCSFYIQISAPTFDHKYVLKIYFRTLKCEEILLMFYEKNNASLGSQFKIIEDDPCRNQF